MAMRLDMRVDMRRWALVFLWIGVMGGGCSARSLLSVKFTVGQGESVVGKPRITVESAGGTIRQTEDLDTVVDVRGERSASVGLYLDYEGSVHVTATVSTEGGCKWAGASDGFSTSVHRGESIEVKIALKPGGTECIARADGGVDGGGPDAEAGTDGPAEAEVRPALVPDGGTDSQAKLDACIDYCTAYRSKCSEWGAAGLSQGECIGMCRLWPTGDPDEGSSQNTLACRLSFLKSVYGSGSVPCAMCAVASPESPGMCNSSVADAGRGACYGPTDAGDAEGP